MCVLVYTYIFLFFFLTSSVATAASSSLKVFLCCPPTILFCVVETFYCFSLYLFVCSGKTLVLFVRKETKKKKKQLTSELSFNFIFYLVFLLSTSLWCKFGFKKFVFLFLFIFFCSLLYVINVIKKIQTQMKINCVNLLCNFTSSATTSSFCIIFIVN